MFVNRKAILTVHDTLMVDGLVRCKTNLQASYEIDSLSVGMEVRTTEPAVTLAVCVEAAEAQDPALQRRSSEVTSVTYSALVRTALRRVNSRAGAHTGEL